METHTISKRLYALMTVIVILLNMFSPYGVLIHKVYAAIQLGEPYYELEIAKPSTDKAYIEEVRNTYIDTEGDEIKDLATYWRYVEYMEEDADSIEECAGEAIVINLRVRGSSTCNGGLINLTYDSSKITPTRYRAGKGLSSATKYTQFATTLWGSASEENLNTTDCQIKIDGGISPAQKAEGKDYLYDGEIVAQFVFKLEDGVTVDDLDTSTFGITPSSSLDTGLMLAYFVNENGKDIQYNVDSEEYLTFSGFSQGAKKISGITISTNPTKNKYYLGETLDLSDGKITVSYDDGTNDEPITIASAIASGKLTISTTVALNTKKVTLEYEGKTVDYDYYVLDSIAPGNDLTKMDYEHDDVIEFAGGTILATYKNSSNEIQTASLNIANEITAGNISVDKTKANIDNKKVTYTYHDKTCEMTLNVTDPIDRIVVTTQPTKVEWDDGNTINFAGGEITPYTKSGKAQTPVAITSSSVTKSTSLADINSIPVADRWTKADGKQAGKQKITLTYEGKTAKLEITVNDTIASITITTQPTAKNKYGTPEGSVNFGGIVAEATTTGGATITLGENSLTIDKTGYNPNTTAVQEFTVKYGNITASNKAQIQLINYITGITANFTKTEFDYETTLADVLANGTYTEIYADKTTSGPKPITDSMVTGYTEKPAAALFTNGICNQNLTIKLSTSSNEFDMLPATTNQTITTKDIIDKVEMEYLPSKREYDYGETFVNGSGSIKVIYKSGNTSSVSISSNKISLTETDGSTINMRPPKEQFTNEVATKTIKVTYTDNGKTYDTSFDIKINDVVTNIAITTDPKKQFNYAETFVTTGGKLTVTYESGNIDEKDLNEDWVSEQNGSEVEMSPNKDLYQTTDTISKTLKVSYGAETTTYSITIKNNVSSIAMKTYPTNINYNIGDTTYDLTNTAGTEGYADIIVTYQAGNTKTVKLTETTLTSLNTLTSTAGDNKAVTVTYGTKQDGTPATTTFNINVKDSVLSIAVTEGKEPPEVLKVGEELDVTGGYITVTKANGSTQVAITRDMVKNFNKEQLGDQTLRIEYGQDVNGNPVWTTYPVVVKDYVESVTINPTTVTGKYGESLSKIISDNNITYTVKYKKAGEQTAVALTTGMVAGYNENTTDTQNLTVTYTDTVKDLYENCNTGTATLNITLKNTVKDIAITAPTKTQYNHGDTLDNPTIVVTYEDNTTKTVKDARNYIFEADGTTPAIMTPTSVTGTDYDAENYKWTKNFVIKYSEGEGADKKEESVEYNNVTINNQVQDIEMFSSPTKQEYNINDDTWNLTGAKITVTRKAGPAYQIDIEESMVPALNTLTTAKQENKPVTVTYEGKPATFNINIVNGVKTIVITAPTNDEGTKFEHGDTLTFGNGTIVVTYADKTSKNVTITSSMVKETLTGNEVNMSPTYEGEYKTNKKITKNLTIEYSEGGVSADAKEYSITITNPIQNIAITEYPQNEFKVNETVTNKGAKGKITITRKSNHTDEIAITGTMIKNDIDTSVEISNVKNYVVYQDPIETAERELEYTYNVTNGVQSVSIKVPDNESDLVFNYGDTITYKSGAINKVSLSNVPTSTPGFAGATIIDKNTGLAPTTALDYSKFDANNEAKITIQVSYIEPTNNALTDTKEYEITVKNNVNTLRIDPEPTDTTYNVNDAIYKLEGGKLKIQRAVGPEKEVDLKDITFTPEGNTITDLTTLTTTANAGTTQLVTITYEGKPATFNINIVNGITGVTITKPSKTEYEHGETLSLEGNVVLHYADGTDNSANPIPLTLSMFTENGGAVNMSPDAGTYDQTTFKQSKTVQITYTDENGNSYDPIDYTFTLENVIDHLEYVVAPTGTYELGETIIYPIGTIKTVRKAKDESNPIDIISDMVTNLSTETATTEGKTAKITYAGKTLDYIYEVHDFVDSVVITVPTNDEGLKFFHGDELTFGNGSITINYKSSPGTPTPITGSMTGLTVKEVVNGTEQNVDMHNNTYGSDNKATKTIRLTYEKDGKTDTKDYTITITNDITKIEIVEPTDRTYNVGDTSYKLAGGQVKVYRSNNNSAPAETITLPNNNFNITPELSTLTTAPGNGKTVTITYNGADIKPDTNIYGTFTIDVKSDGILNGVTINIPTKHKYFHEESLDLSTGSIELDWQGKPNESIDIDPTWVTEEDGSQVDMAPIYDSTNKVSKILKIKYEYTAADGTVQAEENYPIEIINKVSSITIVDEPKKDYNHSQEIDKTVGTFEVIWQNGSKKTIPLADPRITIENFDTSSQGRKNVNVKFTENGESASTSYAIEVTDNVSKIEIVGTPKQDYNCLDSLDLSGLQLEVTRPSGTETISINEASITGFNTNTPGEQTITVSYGGQTTTFKVNVKDWLKDIEFTKPTKKNYKKTDTQINLAGAWVTEVYASGKKIENIEVTQSMLSKFDNTKVGEQTIEVNYKTFTRTFKVIISDGLAGINVTKFPIDEYLYGESLNLAGATLEVVTESGETKEIPITKDMITGYETKPASNKFNKAGEYIQTITITYTEEGVTKKTSYPITTKDYFDKIKVQGLETNYNYGEDIKVAGATVSKVSASGIVSDTTALTKDMISGYDSKKEGNQTITIKYQGKETKQTVKVIDNILGISINSNPSKTNYDYASSLNLSGAKLNVIKNSGTKVINITKDMVTGYNARKSGTQTITVTYAGLKATFTVTVGAKPYVPPVQKPTTPVAEEPVVEEPVIEEPVVETPVIQKPIEKPVEKTVQTEVKEETKIDPILVSSVALGGLAILLLILLLLTKKNVEIYLEEEKDIKLIGKAKLNKKDGQKLDITKYTNKYPNQVLQVVFSKSISKKLDEKTVRIITGENKEKPVIIKYEKEEFITEINNKKRTTKEKIEK